mmetsp:Transcript_5126/g.9318  ORF Transcript_5126/g.9318 Transcript_5126/m.9318 type:complete len:218 (-) Transcript_5126:370-1023(-)
MVALRLASSSSAWSNCPNPAATVAWMASKSSDPSSTWPVQMRSRAFRRSEIWPSMAVIRLAVFPADGSRSCASSFSTTFSMLRTFRYGQRQMLCWRHFCFSQVSPTPKRRAAALMGSLKYLATVTMSTSFFALSASSLDEGLSGAEGRGWSPSTITKPLQALYSANERKKSSIYFGSQCGSFNTTGSPSCSRPSFPTGPYVVARAQACFFPVISSSR